MTDEDIDNMLACIIKNGSTDKYSQDSINRQLALAIYSTRDTLRSMNSKISLIFKLQIAIFVTILSLVLSKFVFVRWKTWAKY